MANTPQARNAAFSALRAYALELEGVEPEAYPTMFGLAAALADHPAEEGEALAPPGTAAQVALTDLIADLMFAFGEEFVTKAFEDGHGHYLADLEEGS